MFKFIKLQNTFLTIRCGPVKILERKFIDRPVGIWISWVALLYCALHIAKNFVLLGHILPSFYIVRCPLLIIAVFALALRRLTARAFCGMAFALLLADAVDYSLPFAAILAVVGFWGISINRRWFDEKLPKTD